MDQALPAVAWRRFVRGAVGVVLGLLVFGATNAGLTGCMCSEYKNNPPGVWPSTYNLAPGETGRFWCVSSSLDPDPSRNTMTVKKWTASAGTITPEGRYTAPLKAGTYTITATLENGASYTATAVAKQSGESPASGQPSPAPSGSVAQAQGEKERIFEVSSGAGGHPGAKIPEFTIDRPRTIVEIMTYHWDYNDHKLGTIALENVDTGETYGPWETVGAPGQGGVENAYWLAHPNVEIPADTYRLVDSSPSTWFTNSEMKGFGGCYVDALK